MAKYEVQTKSIPPTIDDIVKAQRENKLFGSEKVKKSLKIISCLDRKFPIEQFNFGPLKLDTVREAQKEAIEFIEYGCFTFPYEECLYRASVQYDNMCVGFTILVVDGRAIVDSADTILHSRYDGIATVSVVHSQDEMYAMHAINMLNVQHKPEGRAVELHIPQSELSYWKGKIDFDHNNPSEDSMHEFLEGAMLAMGLTMILNTKGIRKERCEPAHKPQQARIKSNKPLLPYVTRVYTDVYNRAVEAGTGTHASPRPHRRRAHVRHIPQREEKPAYNIPIAAMLVNWDGQPLTRGQYEVK